MLERYCGLPLQVKNLTVLGDTVNVAQRIEDIAEPGKYT